MHTNVFLITEAQHYAEIFWTNTSTVKITVALKTISCLGKQNQYKID